MTEKTRWEDKKTGWELGIVLANAVSMKKQAAEQDGDPCLWQLTEGLKLSQHMSSEGLAASCAPQGPRAVAVSGTAMCPFTPLAAYCAGVTKLVVRCGQ